jgi:hypothetical protein
MTKVIFAPRSRVARELLDGASDRRKVLDAIIHRDRAGPLRVESEKGDAFLVSSEPIDSDHASDDDE